MERSPQRIYPPEFRSEAIKLAETTGMSVARAAKQLSIPKSGPDNWVRASRKGQLSDVGKGQRLSTELELERSRTREELADVKMERDLLILAVDTALTLTRSSCDNSACRSQ